MRGASVSNLMVNEHDHWLCDYGTFTSRGRVIETSKEDKDHNVKKTEIT